MKVTLKKAAAILMIVISSLSFTEDDRRGFLSNMRELKEISDIMDVIQMHKKIKKKRIKILYEKIQVLQRNH